jgi:hypothetical protein
MHITHTNHPLHTVEYVAILPRKSPMERIHFAIHSLGLKLISLFTSTLSAVPGVIKHDAVLAKATDMVQCLG